MFHFVRYDETFLIHSACSTLCDFFQFSKWIISSLYLLCYYVHFNTYFTIQIHSCNTYYYFGKWFSEGVNRKSSMQTIQPKMHNSTTHKKHSRWTRFWSIESSVTKQLCPLDFFGNTLQSICHSDARSFCCWSSVYISVVWLVYHEFSSVRW